MIKYSLVACVASAGYSLLCTMPNSFLPEPFSAYTCINDQTLIDQDEEGLLPLIAQYAPIVYLHPQEKFLPIWANEYYAGAKTSLRRWYGKPGSSTDPLLLKAGTVTFEKLYDTYGVDRRGKPKKPFFVYINNPRSVHPGSNPKDTGFIKPDKTVKNKNERGELTVPMYVITSEQVNNKKERNIYIQYIFLYGFNGPFEFGGVLPGDYFAFQGAHESDIEHLTLEVDCISKKLKRIYYSSHEIRDGFWLDAHDRIVEHDETGRLIVYSANHSHGTYPNAGKYIRFAGLANDYTDRGLKWVPENLMRIFAPGDPRFDPKTMGFTFFHGFSGRRGIPPMLTQRWSAKLIDPIKKIYANKITITGDIGRPAGQRPENIFVPAGKKKKKTAPF